MDNSILTHEDILHFNFQYDVAIIERHSKKFEDHLEFISNYSGRHEQNYKMPRLLHSLENENRFNIGALLIFINSILVRSLMIEKYKNWIMISRLISHDYPKYPLLTSLGEDAILDIAENSGSDGIFSTINTTNKMYANCVDTKKFRMFNDADVPLYRKHLEVISNIKKMNRTIIFKNTEQFVLYRQLKNNSIEELFNESA
jgi:hypothetical protein